MRRCSRCQTEFPDFLLQCPACDVELSGAKDYKSLATLVAIRTSIQKPQTVRDMVRKHAYEWMEQGPLRPPEQVNLESRQNMRAQCEVFFDRYQREIGSHFTRERLFEYFERYLADSVSPNEFEIRARELIRLLHSYVFRTVEAERRQQEQQEAERRRLADEERQRAERSKTEAEATRQEQTQIQGALATLQQRYDSIQSIIDNPSTDPEMKLKAIEALIRYRQSSQFTESETIEPDDL